MFHPGTPSKSLGWRTVKNQFATRSSEEDLVAHILRPMKKIRRRTRILNRELTRFARLKSYSQYVKIKRNILKKVFNENIEDELYSTGSSDDDGSSSHESLSLLDTDESTLSRTAYEKLAGGYSKTSKHVQEATQTRRTANEKLADKCSRSSKHVQGATRTVNEELVGGRSKASNHVQEHTQTSSARKRARARRNLTPLLDNVETTNHLVVYPHGNSRASTVKNPKDDDDENNRESSRETRMEHSTVQITNIPNGDSGIDDDSQDNSSTNNRENDYAMELDDMAGTSNRNDRRLEDSPNGTMMSDGEGSAYADMEEEDEEEKKKEEAEEEEKGKVELAEEEEVEEEKKGKMELAEEEMEEEEEKKGKEKVEKKEEEMAEEKVEEEERSKQEMEEEKKDELQIEDKEKEEELDEEEKEEELDKEEKGEEFDEEEKGQEMTEKDTLQFDMNDELSKKKCQPIIKFTEIVTSKYRIIREQGDDEEDEGELRWECTEQNFLEHNIDHTLEESTESDEKSPESKRVNQMKRMNLFCSGSDSDSSESDDNLEQTRNTSLHKPSLPSQIISDFSDSEYPSDSSSFHITDIDESPTVQIPPRQDQDKEVSRKTGFAATSIKDQIEKQEIADSSMIFARENADALEDEKEKVVIDSSEERCSRIGGELEDDHSKGKRHGPSKAQSRQYAFRNISETSFTEKELTMCADNMQQRDPLELSPNGDESLMRPIELPDFVTRQGLIPTCELSTITAKNIPTSSGGQEDDENIWLMEIPKSIITDPELCGKTMLIGNGNIRIGEINYETTLRHEKIVSCILRSKKKKARYKTVNITPVCSINIRHERAEAESFSATQMPQSPSSVPFPKNLKVRNPLTMKKECRASSPKSTHRNTVKMKEKQQKKKKLKKDKWHMDNFISKSKKRRMDSP